LRGDERVAAVASSSCVCIDRVRIDRVRIDRGTLTKGKEKERKEKKRQMAVNHAQ